MARDLPSLDGRSVRGEGVDGGDKKDEEREERGAVGHSKDEEVD